jgi:hypothetical protein
MNNDTDGREPALVVPTERGLLERIGASEFAWA